MKWFLRSKTVIGVILAALPVLLPAFGVEFSADDIAFVNTNVDAFISGIGAALALYGRYVAKDDLTLLPAAK